jgi:hypothetical protein
VAAAAGAPMVVAAGMERNGGRLGRNGWSPFRLDSVTGKSMPSPILSLPLSCYALATRQCKLHGVRQHFNVRQAAACLGVWMTASRVAAAVASRCGGRAAAAGCKVRCGGLQLDVAAKLDCFSKLYLDRFINFFSW